MNRFRTFVLMAAGFVVLVMVVGVFSAGPAIAQAVRAALVSNVDDPGRIPYAVSARCLLLAGENTCSPSLPRVLAGKRLVITHVSGNLASNLPGGSLILVALQGGYTSNYFVTTYQGTLLGRNVFVFGQSVLMVYDSGQAPSLFVEFGSAAPDPQNNLAEFNLTGYMLDCSTSPCAAFSN